VEREREMNRVKVVLKGADKVLTYTGELVGYEGNFIVLTTAIDGTIRLNLDYVLSVQHLEPKEDKSK
jgi:hypothetical protein